MTWIQFLEFMRGPGVNVIAGAIYYFVANWWPALEFISPRARRLIVFAMCMFAPIIATLLEVVTLGVPIIDFPTTWWPVIVAGWAAFSTSTLLHTSKLSAEKTIRA